MIYFPNCKINIGLRVLEKRIDGFHNIESVFYPLTLCDALEIRPLKEGTTKITITGIDSNISSKDVDKNTCIKAYNILKQDFPQIKAINIHLDKAIPTFAGLGGGSSDGSYTLKLLNFVFKLNLTNEDLLSYAQKIGSDCMFFINNNPAFVSGKGEKIKEINLSLKDYYIVLIKPNINISTKEAYSEVDENKKETTPLTCLSSLETLDIKYWKKELVNDFEEPLFKKYPLLRQTKEMLYEKGAIYSQMSGSGSTIYGLFEKEVDLKRIKQDNFTFIYQEKIK
jgi:4-diphosphocytidyl-2-C-methyl-D-erythritol kinase